MTAHVERAERSSLKKSLRERQWKGVAASCPSSLTFWHSATILSFLDSRYVERAEPALRCFDKLPRNNLLLNPNLSQPRNLMIQQNLLSIAKQTNAETPFIVIDLQRIKEYPAKGFQIEQDILANVWDAFEFLVSAGYTKSLI